MLAPPTYGVLIKPLLRNLNVDLYIAGKAREVGQVDVQGLSRCGYRFYDACNEGGLTLYLLPYISL